MAEPGMTLSGCAGQPVMGIDPNGKAQHIKVGTGGGALVEGSQTQGDYETVAASQTDQAMGATGAAGDYLDHVTIIPATTSPGAVSIKDGAGSAITIFAGGASSVADLKPFTVFVGMRSASGAWKVTTGTNVSALGVGDFT